MVAANEMARLKREIEALAAAIEAALRPGARRPTASQLHLLRSDMEDCVQRLDELRSRLSR